MQICSTKPLLLVISGKEILLGQVTVSTSYFMNNNGLTMLMGVTLQLCPKHETATLGGLGTGESHPHRVLGMR